MTGVNYSQLCQAYRNIRDQKAQLKREFDEKERELKGHLTAIENVLLAHLNATGSESVRTEAGTFFKTEVIRPAIADDATFWAFMKSNDAMDALERRVKAQFVKDYMEENGAPPPGLNVHREYAVRVRAPE